MGCAQASLKAPKAQEHEVYSSLSTTKLKDIVDRVRESQPYVPMEGVLYDPFDHIPYEDRNSCATIPPRHRFVDYDTLVGLVEAYKANGLSLEPLEWTGLKGDKNAVPTEQLIALSNDLPRLRFLSLWVSTSITQAGIDVFCYLQYLDVSCTTAITNVHACSDHLLVLGAELCSLDDAGIAGATRLVKLDASRNYNISTVSPFGSTLRELNAGGYACGITDEGLRYATCLVKLNASYNKGIRTVAPFCWTLRELDAFCSSIDDAGIACATSLVKLTCESIRGTTVTTVEPFAATLRELNCGSCHISDSGLAKATSLVKLDVSGCLVLTTVAPFGSTLRELDATSICGINDAGLSDATSLVTLHCDQNPNITTITPFAKTLRVVSAQGKDCGLSEEALNCAESLVKVDAKNNPRCRRYTKFF